MQTAKVANDRSWYRRGWHRWYRGRLDLAYRSWLRRGRRIMESRDALRSAQAVFDSLGAAAWTAPAEREMRAAGQRPHRSERDGWTTLSAQELHEPNSTAALGSEQVAATA